MCVFLIEGFCWINVLYAISFTPQMTMSLDAGLLLTLSSRTVSHGEESDTKVEKKPLLVSE